MMKCRSKAALIADTLNSLSSFLNSEHLLPHARILNNSFSRTRKLPLSSTMFFSLFRHGSTISEDIDFIFQKMSAPPSKNAVLHRQSILNHDVWKAVLKKQISLFYGAGLAQNRYKGYLLVAIDGSKVMLPESPALNQIFGGPLNKACRTKEELITPSAHISAAYDPLNCQILDFIMEPYNVSEIPMMREHLDRLLPFLEGKKVLIMADRYYGSVELFRWCALHGFDFLVRAKNNFFKDLRGEIPEAIQDARFTVTLNKPWIKRIKDPEIRQSFQEDPDVLLRLVRNDYSYQQEDTAVRKKDKKRYKVYKHVDVHAEYFTSLPAGKFSREEILSLYHDKRWDVETCYDRLKNDVKLNQVHSRNPILIRNQFFAKVIFSNIAGILFNAANDRIDSPKHLPNYKKIIQILYSFTIAEKIMKEKIRSTAINRIIKEAIRNKILIRKGRHVRRWGRFMISIPTKKYRIGGRSNPKVHASRYGGYVTTNH